MININGLSLYQPKYDSFYTNIYQAFMVLPWGKPGKPGCPSPFARGQAFGGDLYENNERLEVDPGDFHGDLPKLVMTVTVRHGLSMALIEIDGLPN